MPEPSKPGWDFTAFGLPQPGLHLVATPIGNLGDISLRALAVLAMADIIYCEDTRHTRRLMNRFGLKTSLRTYHDHNAAERRPEILKRLAAGQTVALVSDAGTPLVSDPGFKLVREAIAADHAVTAEPGASSATTALILSGLPTDRFLFLGFLPPKTSARRTEITAVAEIKASLVLFESPTRLTTTLSDLSQILGPRPAAIARELTKIHEDVERADLATLAARAKGRAAPKGEIVIVIGPPPSKLRASDDELDAALKDSLAQGSLKAAVAEVATRLGLPRREVYARALRLTQSTDD